MPRAPILSSAPYRSIRQCRLCGGARLGEVLSLGRMALTGVFPRSAAEEVPAGPLELVRCEGDCGLVQLAHSYDPNLLYGERYGYWSHLNRSMVAHLGETARAIRERTGFARGDVWIDIGSNDGTLLRSIGVEGAVLVGVDPAARRHIERYPEGAHVVDSFFSREVVRGVAGRGSAKVVTSIAMFYDLESPLDFARQVAELLAPDGVWVCEQSYLPAMLAANAYDTICHEHLEYYGVRQLAWIAAEAGLKIVDVTYNGVNGGSFAVTLARVDARYDEAGAAVAAGWEREADLERSGVWGGFARAVERQREQLNGWLDGERRAGRAVLGYGASTKGNVILQHCGIGPERLAAIAEVNPAKFGCVTPGTKIPIVDEAEARGRRPDAFLVFPWHFRENIRERERGFLEAGGRLVFPLPELEELGA